MKLVALLSVLLVHFAWCRKVDDSVNKVLIEFIEKESNNVTVESNVQEQSGELQQCPPNRLIDQFSAVILPEDYEPATKDMVYEEVEHMNDTMVRLDRLQTWLNNVTVKLEYVRNRLMIRVVERLMEENLPAECQKSLARIGNGIQNREGWALRFLEVTQLNHFTMNNGILSLPNADYDECLLFSIPQTSADEPLITGQYCSLDVPDILPKNYHKELDNLNNTLLTMIHDKIEKSNNHDQFPNDMAPNKGIVVDKNVLGQLFDMIEWSKNVDMKSPMAICLPRTCHTKDIETAINKAVYPIIRMPVAINPDCEYKDKQVTLKPHQIFTISLFTLLIACVIVATLVDIFTKNKVNDWLLLELAQCFSGTANFRRIFKRRKNNKYGVLDGVKTFLAFHVLNMHHHLAGLSRAHTKSIDTALWNDRQTPFQYFFERNIHFIDIFFMIGGLATCEEVFAILKHTKGRFNFSQFVIFRYLRIIPPLIGAITLYYIFPIVGSGPLWSSVTPVIYDQCTNNWLPSVTMTNNLFPLRPDTVPCNFVTWYISADFHLRVLSPLIILVIYKWPRMAIPYCLVWLVFSAGLQLIPKLVWDVPYMMELFKRNSLFTMWDSVFYNYNRSEPHLVAYVLGILLAFLVNYHPKAYFGGRIGELLLWSLTWTMTFGAMIWTNVHYMWDYTISFTEILLFLLTSRTLHLSGWFWFTYACATGRGGFITRFFSAPVFTSISNLSYELMLLHSLPILYRIASARSPAKLNFYNTITNSCGDFLFTYLLAIAFYLIVSRPFVNLLGLWLKSLSKRVSN